MENTSQSTRPLLEVENLKKMQYDRLVKSLMTFEEAVGSTYQRIKAQFIIGSWNPIWTLQEATGVGDEPIRESVFPTRHHHIIFDFFSQFEIFPNVGRVKYCLRQGAPLFE